MCQRIIRGAVCAALAVGCTAQMPDPATSAPVHESPWNRRDVVTGHVGNRVTPQEQDLVVHLNLARSDVRGYTQTFIAPRRALFHENMYFNPLDASRKGRLTKEGAAGVDDAVRELNRTPSMAPLTVSPTLNQSARDHALEQSRSGATGHEGNDGSSPATRVQRHGDWGHAVGEVIAYGPVSGSEIVSGLLIDDGIPSRGHRRTILNPRFRFVGVSIQTHPRFGHVAVVDFADAVSDAGQ